MEINKSILDKEIVKKSSIIESENAPNIVTDKDKDA